MKPSGLRQKRAIIAAAILAAVLGAAGASYDFWPNLSPSAVAQPAPAEPAAIGAMGRVEPQSEIVNVATGTVDRLDSLLVRRGDVVKKGQILGYLQGYRVAVAELGQIAAELEEAKAQLAAETELDEAHIDDAATKLKLIEQVTPFKIDAQEKTVESLAARLANDKKLVQSAEQLAQQNITSRNGLDTQKSAVVQEQAGLAAAQAQLDEMRRQFDLDQEDGKTQLRLAKATLDREQAGFPVQSLTKALALANERVSNATVTAPIDGTILNTLARPGELVGGDRPVVTMGDTSRMRVVAEVYETDIGRVRLGATAVITSRAIGRPLTGKVVEIGRLIFKNDVLNVDPAARADARVVEVRIELDDGAPVAGLTNLTVDVRINGEGSPVAGGGNAGLASE